MHAFARLRRRQNAEDDETEMPKGPTDKIVAEDFCNADASSFGGTFKTNLTPGLVPASLPTPHTEPKPADFGSFARFGGVTQLTQACRSRGGG
jgi:hypothetical protein